jgi:hypothetical protein
MEPIQQVLVQDGEFGHQVRQVWNAFLGFANTVMVIALLVIAFANILHIQLDKYAVKKILPSLIMAIVLANFSFFICRFLIDIANMVLNFVLTAGGSGTSGKILESINIKTTADPKVGMSNFWGVLWGFLLVHVGRLVGAIFIAILGYLFFIRNWVIYFLVALSPLAFIAMAIPQGQSVFSTWWKQFIQWVFMPVVSAFWLWVGGQFLSAMGTSAGATISFAFTIACFYFAFTTPFKMGGAIMKGWGGFGKKLISGSGNNALTNYAKQRWVNPLIKDAGVGIQNWYGNRILGGEKDEKTGKFKRKGIVAKALGWHYDRSKTVAINREDRANRWKNIQNQMQANTMNYWSDKKKLARSFYVDEANAFLGEIERTEADMRLQFLNTDKGVEALQRSLAYAKHMDALNQGIKNAQTKRNLEWTQESNHIIKDKNGNLILSGDGYWTRQQIHDKELLERHSAGSLELADRKKFGDIGGTQEDVAAKADMHAVNLRNFAKAEEVIRSDRNINENTRQKRLRKIAAARETSVRQFESMLEKHYEETDGRASPLMKEMLGDAATYDATKPKGSRLTIKRDKLASIKTIGEHLGYDYDSEERKIISDRAGKVLTNHTKDELATEREKRQGVESGINLNGNNALMEAMYSFWAGRLMESGTWKTRDAFARFENLLVSATNYQDPTFKNSQKQLWNEVRNLTRANTDAATGMIRQNNQVLSDTLTAVLQEKNFTQKIGALYAAAASKAGFSFTDESSFLALQKKAEADKDTALSAKLDTIAQSLQAEVKKQLLAETGVDESTLKGNITVELKTDDYGHTSGVHVENARGLTGSEEEIKDALANLQHMYEHISQQFVKTGSRSPVSTAFFGAMRTAMSCYRTQHHSFLEQEMGKNETLANDIAAGKHDNED